MKERNVFRRRVVKSCENFSQKQAKTLDSIVERCLYSPAQIYSIRTTHTRITRSYFAYTRMSIRVYAYVHTRVYVPLLAARICPFVGLIRRSEGLVEKNAISPRLLCYATIIWAFHHCTKKPTMCFKVACPCLL